MSRLAEDLGVALPNATGIVDRLCERGLVERMPDAADRRVVRVCLTDAGRQLVDEMEAGRRERLRRLFGALTPAQQRRLALALRDLAGAAATLAT
jgi:DNA-binding MarR family transcriptional regulator